MDLHPRWHDPVRRKTESRLGNRLTDLDWLHILEERYLEDDIDRLDENEQPEVLANEIRRLRRIGELPRASRILSSYRHNRVEWLTDDESTMAAAISDALAWRATTFFVGADGREQWQGRSRDEALALWEASFEIDDSESRGFRDWVFQVADWFGWKPEVAAIYLLTGRTPLIEPLCARIEVMERPDEYDRTTSRSRARIVLDFDPWLSEETVVHAYREMRRQLLGKGAKRPEVRELEVFRFVVARLDDRGQPLANSWSALGRAWNDASPCEWHFAKPERIKPVYEGVRDRLINSAYLTNDTARHFGAGAAEHIASEGGRERGVVYQVFVDHRHRTPNERKRPAQHSQRDA